MTLIKVTYDNGNNGLVKVMREAHKSKKMLSQMTSNEIARMAFGLK